MSGRISLTPMTGVNRRSRTCVARIRTDRYARAGLEPVRIARAALSPPCSGRHICGMAKSPGKPPQKRDPAKHSKKDPAKPTRAKASRPDLAPIEPALAQLLNPGIAQGTAGPGSQTGLKPPPDNSFDRRRDFSDAHRARKSTQGFSEAPQSGYVAKTPASPGELDPDLARALGIDEDEGDAASRTLPWRGRVARRRRAGWGEYRTGSGHRFERSFAHPHPIALRAIDLPPPGGGGHRPHGRRFGNQLGYCRGYIVLPRHHGIVGHRVGIGIAAARGAAEFTETAVDTAPAAAAGEVRRRRPRSSSSPTSSPRATSRRRSPTWSRACERQRPHPGAARRHRLGQDLHDGEGDRGRRSARRWCSRPTRRWPRSSTASSRSFFPDNAVEYFVSYYDYYQPEAYVPRTDTYIEKESSINEQIDRMRHSATRSLLERDDVIIVASVSCIYGIGSVETYSAMTFSLKRGERIDQRQLIADLVALQYKRSGGDFFRGTFRVRGDMIDIFPAHYEDRAWRVIAVRRRGLRIDRRVRSAHRPQDRRAEVRQDLRQLALRHAAPDADPGDPGHQARAARAARAAQCRRPAAGSAAAGAAHAVRPRNDGGDRLLRRHRELFALSHRPQPGRAAADAVRIRARQRAGVRRREPRHDAAARRHVPRRLPPQGDARRIRLPPAVVHGQPAAAVRGVGRHAAADHGGLGDAGRLGDRPRPAACSPSR